MGVEVFWGGAGQVELSADAFLCTGRYDECVKLAEELGKREEGKSRRTFQPIHLNYVGPLLKPKLLPPLCFAVLNILVNNSGATWGESLETYPDQAFSKLMTLNVQRVFTLCQKLVPMLKKGAEKNGVGRIINVSWRQGPGGWFVPNERVLMTLPVSRLDLSMVRFLLLWRRMPTRPPKQLFTSESNR